MIGPLIAFAILAFTVLSGGERQAPPAVAPNAAVAGLTPKFVDVNGVRTFFSGGSDGAMHALKLNTGEKIWSWRVTRRWNRPD